MDSAALTPEQLDKLLHGIARSRDYTFRLIERMNAAGFPDTGPLKAASVRARDAVEALYQAAAELGARGEAAEVGRRADAAGAQAEESAGEAGLSVAHSAPPHTVTNRTSGLKRPDLGTVDCAKVLYRCRCADKFGVHYITLEAKGANPVNRSKRQFPAGDCDRHVGSGAITCRRERHAPPRMQFRRFRSAAAVL
jgi:hypothetical protein